LAGPFAFGRISTTPMGGCDGSGVGQLGVLPVLIEPRKRASNAGELVANQSLLAALAALD
jgi:hypothetical protein